MTKINFSSKLIVLPALILGWNALNAMQGRVSVETLLHLKKGVIKATLEDTQRKDLLAKLEQMAPNVAFVIKCGLPFDLENGAAMSYRMDNGIADPQTGTPYSVYASSLVKAAGCYVIWQTTKKTFEKVTGQPLAIPTIDSTRYKNGSLKYKASTVANLGIEGVNIGIDLVGPLGVSYLANALGQHLDKEENN